MTPDEPDPDLFYACLALVGVVFVWILAKAALGPKSRHRNRSALAIGGLLMAIGGCAHLSSTPLSHAPTGAGWDDAAWGDGEDRQT